MVQDQLGFDLIGGDLGSELASAIVDGSGPGRADRDGGDSDRTFRSLRSGQ